MVKILGDTYIPATPNTLLSDDIINSLSIFTDKEQTLQVFRKLFKRIYNGTVFEQETIFKTIVHTIISVTPEHEIKQQITSITKLAENFTIPNMSEFLTSITGNLAQFSDATLKIVFVFLYNYVNDTEDEYNKWYTNLQDCNMPLMQKMVPIMDWINSDE